MGILEILVGILTGKAGEKIGGAVSMAAQVAAVMAAVTPVALWLASNKEETFITLTYGDLAFWGVLIAAQVLLVIRLVHRAPYPQQ